MADQTSSDFGNGDYSDDLWFYDQRNFHQYYQIGRELGRGTFSIVYEGLDKSSGKRFAIKCIQKKRIKTKFLQREIEIMKTVSHPNIIKLFDVMEDLETIYLILEYVAGGELFDLLEAEERLPEEFVKIVIKQVLSAVDYLHKMKVAHRDLKPENILWMPNANGMPHIWIADFGLSRLFDQNLSMETQCGSIEYTAPEVAGGQRYTEACDLWSIGVMTFVL
eukprot:TRINITY_DN6334_c0_g1_i1.p1 TRINITY_DN6334_c0_g1~~TRINITY_DN6334_c0_g1_i1.p1  ORF type:complete len:221 (-),score=49.75 TRINITY_DN6334_c0_g1_i1:209-871(-)